MQQAPQVQGQPLICTSCGAPLREAPQNGFFVCAYCGTRYPVMAAHGRVPDQADDAAFEQLKKELTSPTHGLPDALCNIPASSGPQQGLANYTVAVCLFWLLLAGSLLLCLVSLYAGTVLSVFNLIMVFTCSAQKKKTRKLVATIQAGEKSVEKLQASLQFSSRKEILTTLKTLIEAKQLVGFAVTDGETLVPVQPRNPNAA